jgi:molecular chaperone DnaK
MVRNAEAHAEEDRRRREEAEVRNQADSLVYSTEKQLRDSADKISGDEKDRVESALASLKEALAGSDVNAIKGATETLAVAVQGFAAKLYEQTGSADAGAAGTAAGGASAPSDDEVVDAEIVDEQGA